ncbi:MAG: hypothetical protein F4X77_00410 [Acidobacteriia bacterium]|nr:hypothetical protein [Terriglobia bacterium]
MGKTPARFHDTDRSFRVYRLSGLIVECWHGKPAVGVLPDDERVEQEDGEEYAEFLRRCEGLMDERFSVGRAAFPDTSKEEA